MPTGLLKLHDVDEEDRSGSQLVDIVAVHGLNEDRIKAWTHPRSGVLWLRDFLPDKIRAARVFTYGFNASASAFFDDGCAKAIHGQAHNLVCALQAERSLDEPKTLRRPIIFVCHGLGGVLVKKAIVYSQTRTSKHVVHLYDIFVSTYAILFFGTPHDHTDRTRWLTLEPTSTPHIFSLKDLATASSSHSREDSDCLRIIAEEFASFVRQFHIFFFWEEFPSRLGSRYTFIVEQASAAPSLDDTERCGIAADHFEMVKFSDPEDSSYKTALEALKRYSEDAPGVILRRWKHADTLLAQLRSNEAFELAGVGFDLRRSDTFKSEYTPPEKSRNKYFYPPQDVTNVFVGREDVLLRIERAFFPLQDSGKKPSSRPQKRFVIHGMGGSGKTQLSCKFSNDYQERYWAVFTIFASTSDTVKDSFSKIGKIGGLEATEDAGKYWLSQLDQPFLVIIDNADDPEMNLADLFPQNRRAHVLITTRNPDFSQKANVGDESLQGLRKSEALRLLLTRAEIPSPWGLDVESTGNEITKALGYLALALIQAGNCIFRKICGLSDYLELHESYKKERESRPKSPDRANTRDEDEIVNVYSTFDLSLNYLQKQDTLASRDALDILNILPFFHAEHIRVDIFTRAVNNRRNALTDTPISSGALMRLVNRLRPPPLLPRFLRDELRYLKPARVTRAIAQLRSLSLIGYDGKDGSFSLHPLVYDWARDRLSSGERKLWAAIALNTLAEAIQLPPQDSGEAHGEFRRDLLPHLNACLTECDIKLPVFDGITSRIEIFIAMLFQQTKLLIIRDQTLNAAKLGYVFSERGKFDLGAKYLSMVKDTLIHLLGYDNPKTMSAMLGLAGTYWGLGRLEEAIELQKRVVGIRSKLYGADHRDTLLAMSQLGNSYWLHGQYSEALRELDETTERMKSALGPDDVDTLAALDNLGVIFGSWHRFEESKKAHEYVLQSRKKKLGPKHLDTIMTMHRLAMVLLDLKKIDEAREMILFVHEERKLQLGKEHPWTLWALCDLCKVNLEAGHLEEAQAELEWGILAGERSLGKGHLGVLMGMGELARIYARQGKLDEAEKLSVETLALLERHRGPAHPDCVYCLWKMALLFEMQGNLERALETCNIGLQRVDMRLTRAHPFGKKLESFRVTLKSRLHERGANGEDS